MLAMLGFLIGTFLDMRKVTISTTDMDKMFGEARKKANQQAQAH